MNLDNIVEISKCMRDNYIFQDDGTERRIPPPIPQEHFGQRVFVKCLTLKYASLFFLLYIFSKFVWNFAKSVHVYV